MSQQSSLSRTAVSLFVLVVVASSVVPAVTLADGAQDELSQSQVQTEAQLAGTGIDSSVVAQQEPPDKDTDGTITKREFRSWIHRIDNSSEKQANQLVRNNPKMATILKRVVLRTGQYQTDPMGAIRRNPKGVVNKLLTDVDVIRVPNLPQTDSEGDGSSGNNSSGNNSSGNGSDGNSRDESDTTTSNTPVNSTIQELKTRKLGWTDLSAARKQQLKTILTKLAQKDLSQPKENSLLKQFRETYPGSQSTEPVAESERMEIIRDNFGIDRSLNIQMPNIPNIVAMQLRGMAQAFVAGAATILTDLYSLAFSTPVPHNSGWHGIFGTPTNEPFQTLHRQLLVEKLYPITNYLLGLGVLVLGASLAVNPFMSRLRIWDLLTKFIWFLLLYAFSWTAISLLHGTVNGITVWLRPSAGELGQLATNIEAIGVGAVGAYFALGGGILSTMFSLGIELGMRQVLLTYVFPYVFPALLLVLYLSPWQRLRGYASMLFWQYINVLTMVIPMAIILRAAVIVDYSPGNGIAAILVLIALFLTAASYPLLSTYLFIQASGSVAAAARSGVSGVSSRVTSATDSVGWGTDSASETTATGGQSTGGHAQAMVDAEKGQSSTVPTTTAASRSSVGGSSVGTSSSGSPSSGASSAGGSPSQTTAGEIRAAFDSEENGDTMSAANMKDYVDQNPKTTTLKEELGQ